MRTSNPPIAKRDEDGPTPVVTSDIPFTSHTRDILISRPRGALIVQLQIAHRGSPCGTVHHTSIALEVIGPITPL